MLGIVALGLLVPALRADQITTFIATGVLTDGASLSGNVVIDTTVGTVLSANLSVGSPLSITGATFFSLFSGQGSGSYTIWTVGTAILPDVILDVPVTTLVGYAGGNICLFSCDGLGSDSSVAQSSSYAGFTSGSLTPTPEPTSVVLVASAMLGLLALRRRIAR
jgi:hypothetical protein